MPAIDDFEEVLKRKGGTDPFVVQDPVEKMQLLFDDADIDAPKVSDSPEVTRSVGWTCDGCGAFVPWNERHECPEIPIVTELKRIADALEKIERKMK